MAIIGTVHFWSNAKIQWLYKIWLICVWTDKLKIFPLKISPRVTLRGCTEQYRNNLTKTSKKIVIIGYRPVPSLAWSGPPLSKLGLHAGIIYSPLLKYTLQILLRTSLGSAPPNVGPGYHAFVIYEDYP